jgi:hypothetical protein
LATTLKNINYLLGGFEEHPRKKCVTFLEVECSSQGNLHITWRLLETFKEYSLPWRLPCTARKIEFPWRVDFGPQGDEHDVDYFVE